MRSVDTRPAQVYRVFIRAPRQKVWDAITQPDFTRRYFYDSRATRPWKVGETQLFTDGAGRLLVEGEIIECDPPRRLVHGWVVHYDAGLNAEGPSRVTWELEEEDGVTKLTAIHDDFPSGSKVYDNVAGGWPYILSGLKTLLETGSPLKPETAAV